MKQIKEQRRVVHLLSVFLLALLLVEQIFPAMVSAETMVSAGTIVSVGTMVTDKGAESADTHFISIDTAHVYEGMEQSFSKGYEPVIKKNTMQLVIPFRGAEELKGNKITVAVGFESGTECPFYYKNYQKKVKGTKENLYLYKCNMELKEDRVNGSYPVHLTVTAKTQTGKNVTEQFTIYVEITDGKVQQSGNGTSNDGDGMNGAGASNDGDGMNEAGASDDGDGMNEDENPRADDPGMQEDQETSQTQSGDAVSEEPVSHQPKLLLESNSLADQSLTAGESYPMVLTIRNCSKTSGIENVKLSLTSEEAGLSFEKSGFYYESVAAGGNLVVEQQITVDKKTAMGKVGVQITIE